MKATSQKQKDAAQALRKLVPLVSYADSVDILTATRQPQMRNLVSVDAVFLATVAHIRHVYTDYDNLLTEGYDHDSARHFVTDQINAVLQDWGASRGVDKDFH